ncbi:hypothetical protein Syun_000736 [Stephania yunnanensis]|uniref:Uncharacterized protein n=1 Tax=Stephania yunnanensis TaxID=152371 RepID=A0AAP0QA72_9MAGN
MEYGADMNEGSMRKGPWLEEEDERLVAFVGLMGERRWDTIARVSGLRRSGKSCRLRWLNYLRPDLKHGQMTAEEECMILQLHKQLGNKWSKIARSLPGRTDNEIKNYWRTHLRKKVQAQEHEIKDEMSKVQEFLMQDGDHHLNIQAANYNYIGSMKENTLTSPFGFGFPDYNPSAALPYEANFHNFISGSLDYQFELKYHDESNSLNTWFCNSTWTSGDDNNVLDSHGSLF